MILLIILFGALTLVAGIIIVINPEVIFGFLRKNLDKLGLHVIAIVVRLVLGALLIVQSSNSRFPLATEIIGWLAVVAALVLMVMGRSNFNRLMLWALSLVKPMGRVGGILAAAFGAFLVYAFI
ncbi:MAG: hypothetical protein HOM55_10980 [Proteobacteria bacterium]|jgi:hypothetical protein|nr:hypothetical protein [Pseudomonadota bacterium]